MFCFRIFSRELSAYDTAVRVSALDFRKLTPKSIVRDRHQERRLLGNQHRKAQLEKVCFRVHREKESQPEPDYGFSWEGRTSLSTFLGETVSAVWVFILVFRPSLYSGPKRVEY